MARRPRIEIEGGLYHVIARGNARRDIFHSREDQLKFISLLEKAKQKLGFHLYAYCLMTNHLHLLIERRIGDVGRLQMTENRQMSAEVEEVVRKYEVSREA
jgi:REP element-mobilizing transposase RayT